MLGPDRPCFSRPSATPKLSPALTANSGATSSEQLRALRQFVARVGGMENARRALEMLAILGPHR
jgi:hypothetical protein